MLKKALLLVLCLLLVLPSALAESLFAPELDGIYNYCPVAFEEDGVIHMYYCTNVKSRIVNDYVGYRTSTDNGQTYSEEQIVLERTPKWGAWDTMHVCDPDVIKGHFVLDGVEYQYLLAYLGCVTGNNQENKVGLAVAKNPEGPYVKLSTKTPFVDFQKDYSTKERAAIFQWGVGQPSLVSIDQAGKVMLIYTSGTIEGTKLICEKWDLSDLNNPVQLGENWKIDVPNTGAVGRDMKERNLNNADFMYDPAEGVLYVTAEGSPGYIEGIDVAGEPTFVSSTVRVYKFSQVLKPEEMEHFFEDAQDESWEKVCVIGMEETGFPRNHNTGFLSDPYGWMAEDGMLRVLYSSSETNQQNNSLWTYRIHEYQVPLK